jgi:hypothetical protein
MIQRKELNKLVVIFINSSKSYPTARELYQDIKEEHKQIIHQERVRGFKSFVKIINSFKEIQPIGNRSEPMVYKLKGNFYKS